MSLFRSRLCAPVIALALSAAVTAASAADTPQDVVFDVYRNGSPFGEHAVRFERAPGGRLEVDINIALRVGFGPLTVFRYEHASEEVWVDGELVQLEASTLKDGGRERYRLQRRADGRLERAGEVIEALPPSSHWSGYAAGLAVVLNTETGEPMDVVIEELGMDAVETATGWVSARRVRMSGSVTVDLWYDEADRWVGCAFSIRGQDIVYRLRNA